MLARRALPAGSVVGRGETGRKVEADTNGEHLVSYDKGAQYKNLKLIVGIEVTMPRLSCIKRRVEVTSTLLKNISPLEVFVARLRLYSSLLAIPDDLK